MTLAASGQLAMSDINTELGLSSTAQISLNDASVRSLALIPSGQISMNDLHGKTFWARPSSGTVTTAVTGGSTTNLSNAYDTTGTSVNATSYALIQHAANGTMSSTEVVTYSGFGTGTKTGTLYINFYASCSGLDGNADGGCDIQVNGATIGSRAFPVFPMDTTNSSGLIANQQTVSVSLTSQNLSTLSVAIMATGGKYTVVDSGVSQIWVYDIVFVGN